MLPVVADDVGAGAAVGLAGAELVAHAAKTKRRMVPVKTVVTLFMMLLLNSVPSKFSGKSMA